MHSLRLHYSREGGNVFVIPELYRNNGQRIPGYKACCGDVCDVDRGTNRLVSALRSAVTDLAPDQSSRNSTLLRHRLERDVRPASSELSRRLLPESLADLLRSEPGVSHIEIHVDPDLQGIPWESLHWENEYLGFRYAVSRWLLCEKRSPALARHIPNRQSRPSRVGLMVDPAGELPESISAAFDRLACEWMAHAGNQRVRLDHDQVQIRQGTTASAFGEWIGQLDVALIIAHHVHRGTRGKSPGLRMSGVDPYTPTALWNDLRKPGSIPPRVFVSLSCESALTDAWPGNHGESEELHGFVDAALQSEIENYIGSMIEVPAWDAATLVPPFLEGLSSGLTVAESMRRARRAFRGEHPDDSSNGGTLLGLAFAHYGHDRSALWSGSGNSIQGNAVRLCEHIDHDGPCLRAIMENERGWSESRCQRHARSITFGSEGVTDCCGDPDRLHPGEKRPVGVGDPGYSRVPKLCNACFHSRLTYLRAEVPK